MANPGLNPAPFRAQPVMVDYSPIAQGLTSFGGSIGRGIKERFEAKKEEQAQQQAEKTAEELRKAWEKSFGDEGYFSPEMFAKNAGDIQGVTPDLIRQFNNTGVQSNYAKSQQVQIQQEREQFNQQQEAAQRERMKESLVAQFVSGGIPSAEEITGVPDDVFKMATAEASSIRKQQEATRQKAELERKKTMSEIAENKAQAESAKALAEQRSRTSEPPDWAKTQMAEDPNLYWDGNRLVFKSQNAFPWAQLGGLPPDPLSLD